ncbi:MAG: ribose 5-phosphate isomerase B [Cyclonatronaceae bacterium]
MKRIPIGSDHAGFAVKEQVKHILENLGYTPVDFGTHNETPPVDYPDFAKRVSEAVDSGEYGRGILVCGSGQGVCMTANKFAGVRAALAWNPEVAALSAQHNDANMLCLPGRFVDEQTVASIVETWLTTEFEGGRHERRVNKISC